jgi:hypothetical protein
LRSIREDDFFVLLKLSKQQCMIWIGELLAAKVLGQCVQPFSCFPFALVVI